MKLKQKLRATLLAASIAAIGATSAQAQISDNAIKIGVLTDMSSL
ncbi:MAG: hypothetical protein ACKODQ_10400 [Betaproteobacteria bacterium]